MHDSLSLYPLLSQASELRSYQYADMDEGTTDY
jgi:hypothetical protein